jgi:cysteinyl-tRNA synthetase
MSKSSGEFLRLQTLVDRGFHPLAYRLMCLQAHYRSEMEFTWEGLAAAQTRLKRMVMAAKKCRDDVSAVGPTCAHPNKWYEESTTRFGVAICEDLNTPEVLTIWENVARVPLPSHGASHRMALLKDMDAVLGLNLLTLTREDLRVRPITAQITEEDIIAALDARKEARAAKDFAKSDAIRDDLIARGVEVMDGDPLQWDWRLVLP